MYHVPKYQGFQNFRADNKINFKIQGNPQPIVKYSNYPIMQLNSITKTIATIITITKTIICKLLC